jgi:hypothetical protein
VSSASLYEDAERRLGRRLTASERLIDIEAADRALEQAKERLAAEIQDELVRLMEKRLRGKRLARLQITKEMQEILVGLYDEGGRQAREELRKMGIEPRREYAELPRVVRALTRALRQYLGAITVRARKEAKALAVEIEVTERARERIAEEVEKRVPGARDAASRLVSGAFDAGLAGVYEDHEDLFPCWQYTAVMDAATCEPCRSKDGTRYESLAELYEDLPNFGPNPLCLGDGRCRCRGIPCLPAERVEREFKPSELLDQQFTRPLIRQQAQRGIDALDRVLTRRARDQPHVIEINNEYREAPIDTRAGYAHNRYTGEPAQILINPNTGVRNIEFSVVHEFGHYVDHTLGDIRDSRFTSGRVADGRDVGPFTEALRELLAVVAESDTTTYLTRVRDVALDVNMQDQVTHLNYMLTPREQFARAFAQFVAEHSGDELILAQLAEERGEPYYGGFNEDEWPAIEAAMETFLREAGWLE